VKIRQKIFQVQAFLKYWLLAVNEHSLQSPFIYELYTRTIKPDPPKEIFNQIEAYRKVLLQSRESIRFTEFGAGSSMSSSKEERPLRQMARHSLSSARFSRLLFRLICRLEAKTILELGTSLGINTLYLSAAAPEGQVYTLEGCPETASAARKLFGRWPHRNIVLEEGNIDQRLPQLLQQLETIDAAYLDANHTYEASMRYFELLLPKLHPHSFLVIDDIYWSAGMQKAWQEMSQHPQVSLSLDLYDAGILFFRPGLRKAHYILSF
jgi:predicted O-methyltransferase YrrM